MTPIGAEIMPYPTGYTTRTTCRVCDSSKLIPLFSLGRQYVSNFVDADRNGEGEPVPIDLERCERCTLVQLKHTAPQELLYRRHYWYRSGVTKTMRKALKDITADIESRVGLNGQWYSSSRNVKPIVLDIGSNDGTLLRSYTSTHITKVGFEPAKNLAKEGSNGVDQYVPDFWNAGEYKKRVNSVANVITAIGMFYDLEDPNQFISDVAECLADEGIFVAQLMCLHNMIQLKDVGNLAHEHLEFYSLKSLAYLFGKHGLTIYDIQTNNVNGQSYRIYAHKSGHEPSDKNYHTGLERVEKQLRIEEYLDWKFTYDDFYAALQGQRDELRNVITAISISGKKRVYVYGASTKGNVVLQYAGLHGGEHNSLISGASDRSPEKWGKYTVGTHILISSEEEVRKANPDFFLVLPYAFLDEFALREQEWRDKGGRFIVPIPQLRIV